MVFLQKLKAGTGQEVIHRKRSADLCQYEKVTLEKVLMCLQMTQNEVFVALDLAQAAMKPFEKNAGIRTVMFGDLRKMKTDVLVAGCGCSGLILH